MQHYNGQAVNIAGNLPPAVNIVLSTNTNPVVVQTATAHGMTTGDQCGIKNHSANYVINGQWTVTVIDATHFSVPVAGVGVGAGSGTVQPLALGPTAPHPSDGDDADAASVDVELQRLADQTAFLGLSTGAWRCVFFDVSVHGVDESGAAYATVTLDGTHQTFVPPQTQYINLPVINGDIVEWEFTGTISLGGVANVLINVELLSDEYLPGASFTPSGLLAPASVCCSGNASGVNYVPITLRSFDPVSQSGLAGVAVAVLAITGVGQVVQLNGSYAWTVRVWRPTGAKQST